MKWNRHSTLVLKAEFFSSYSNPGLWEQSESMEEIAEWCKQNDCGRWHAYDMFKFRTEEEITMFLLRWS
jgi:hypothetical protein